MSDLMSLDWFMVYDRDEDYVCMFWEISLGTGSRVLLRSTLSFTIRSLGNMCTWDKTVVMARYGLRVVCGDGKLIDFPNPLSIFYVGGSQCQSLF